MGQQPVTPYMLIMSYTMRCPAAYKVTKSWCEQADIAWAHVDKATKRMKKWVDNKRRHVKFNVGDLVLVKILLSQHKSIHSLHKGLVQRYEGPFLVIKRVGNVSYKLELPYSFKLHPVFYVSCLKPMGTQKI